ncbi:hypothetical protein CROQUDRAFT_667051 [Cronartium quercuum f. sp. fusiforme G11]|uniref:Uncharacterized protein n=1 Tax=Cronartium quercuum f. sp. fusiforme G11 TaxID=708437 RepID=A0A9P6N4T3_9BASI|nr:hypothetical protein CROQUDRAFT_667051 [Cronartium quercuum f. sp. fusiforme G11]
MYSLFSRITFAVFLLVNCLLWSAQPTAAILCDDHMLAWEKDRDWTRCKNKVALEVICKASQCSRMRLNHCPGNKNVTLQYYYTDASGKYVGQNENSVNVVTCNGVEITEEYEASGYCNDSTCKVLH